MMKFQAIKKIAYNLSNANLDICVITYEHSKDGFSILLNKKLLTINEFIDILTISEAMDFEIRILNSDANESFYGYKLLECLSRELIHKKTKICTFCGTKDLKTENFLTGNKISELQNLFDPNPKTSPLIYLKRTDECGNDIEGNHIIECINIIYNANVPYVELF